MRIRGSISVFISLLLVSVLTLSSAICESIRFRGAKISAVCSLDAAVESSLAKYDKKLLEEFDILGVYFKGINNAEGSISDDINKNIISPESVFLKKDTDFWKLKLNNISFNEYGLLTDNDGAFFIQQAVLYAKESIPETAVKWLSDYYGNNEAPEEIEDYFEAEEKRTDELIEDYSQNAEDEEATYEYSGELIELEQSPVDVVKEIKNNGILSLVLPSDKELSTKSAELSSCVSKRSLKTGIGGAIETEQITDKAFFIEYLFKKLSDFLSPDEEENQLNYMLEYCIGGKESDAENLKYVVNRLLLIKEAVNFAYLLGDATKNSQALAVAVGLVAASGIQPLVELVKYAILLAWAYAESILDVKNLLCGGSSAIVKTAENWKLGIENIANIGNCLSEPVKENNGLDYSAYLRILLMFVPLKDLSLRAMDIIEMQMRYLYKTDAYCLDNLVATVDVTAKFYSTPLFMKFGFMKKYYYKSEFEVNSRLTYL